MTTCDSCQRHEDRARRFRCDSCDRMVCSRCCTRGGSGQGGAHRWSSCHTCNRNDESRDDAQAAMARSFKFRNKSTTPSTEIRR